MKKFIFFLTIAACLGLSSVKASELKHQVVRPALTDTSAYKIPISVYAIPDPVYWAATSDIFHGWEIVYAYVVYFLPEPNDLEYYIIVFDSGYESQEVRFTPSGQIIPDNP